MKIKQVVALAAVSLVAICGGAELSVRVWRGETAYVDVPADSAQVMLPQNGVARGSVEIRLAYYDEVAYETKTDKGMVVNKRPDVYREIPVGSCSFAVDGRAGSPLPAETAVAGRPPYHAPTVCKISAASDAKPGKYTFRPLEVTVIDRVLPPAKDWKYFLDLWQHPWAVARYFNVKPFTKEHYEKMEPIWRALADCGCKALTVTLLDLPWNHQCYDGYYSMIGRVKKADGSWSFDYTLFDEYVAFGRKCGLGPDIACYSMCPWKNKTTWTDADGKYHREKIPPGTPEYEVYWGPFLVDFAAHLKAKGWFGDTYIAMDERKPEDVRKIDELIQRKAPGMKIAICGRTKPSLFNGIKIENFCQGLIHLRSDFIPELKPRRAKGYKTTFYVCFSAKHPNTFMDSPADEGFWLGAYPVMIGFDGFLRWAANSWPKDPYKDASFKTENLKAGDTFLIYPGGELSSRLIALRSGVVAAEKMRILREERNVEGEIKRIAAPYGFRGAVHNAFDFSAFRRDVEAFVNK